MNSKEFEEWKAKKAYEIFEKQFPATCRMPNGEKWPIEKSSTLTTAHRMADAVYKLLTDKLDE